MLGYRSLAALRAFVESGSVAQAAARLGRTAPQVGRLLAALEAELGFALFTRHNRRLLLTAEGARFYAQAERVLAGHDGLDRLGREIRQGRRDDHLRLLIAPQVTNAFIGEALAAMAADVPGFTATVESRIRLDIESWVGQEHFDLAVTVLPLTHPALEVEEFCAVEAVAALHPAHPLAARDSLELADIATQPLVVTHPRSLIRQRLEALFRAAGESPRIRFETSSGAVACQLASRGMALAIADPFVARSSGAAPLVLRRFRPAIPLPYGLLFPTWQPRSATVERFSTLVAGAGHRQAAALAAMLGGPAGARPQ
ncbi:LysR family transcriptional regulator [Pseudoroseomonas deserti]|uniref:LysR family transcriptional regulator n=2 Tax=Teichococcus deserti TaxID=1817963 RepID=A0A1V2H715_9PROT|nr:LysR family transcriptional regulator [Pseudoroseomonas deserti]